MALITPYDYDFRIAGTTARVYSGKDALGNLPAEIKRNRAHRAFIVCGRSVSHKTALIDRLRALLGDALAGVYDEMGKDTPLADVVAARDAARDAQADLLIAVGGGSVIQGTRVAAILLAEKQPAEELATQYPEFGAAISPKLMAPKLPIINILTIGTTAQNRGGSPVKSGGYRLEFFDPKTRPVALFWDPEALLTAPVSMMRTSGATNYWAAVKNMGYVRTSPLADFSRRQVFELMRNSLPRLADPNDVSVRLDLCLATYLQNREVDDGGGRSQHWVGRVTYAFATALFNLHGHVGQGEANSAFAPTVMRRLGARDAAAMCRIAETLGVWHEGNAIEEAPLRAADLLEKQLASIGMPGKVSDLGIPRASAAIILANSLKNFNADPKREFVKERALLGEILDAAW